MAFSSSKFKHGQFVAQEYLSSLVSLNIAATDFTNLLKFHLMTEDLHSKNLNPVDKSENFGNTYKNFRFA